MYRQNLWNRLISSSLSLYSELSYYNLNIYIRVVSLTSPQFSSFSSLVFQRLERERTIEVRPPAPSDILTRAT